jgi:hypothetical protein
VSCRLTDKWCNEQRCSLAQYEKKKNWKVVLEENRNLVQNIIDHPEHREDPDPDWSYKGLQLGTYWKETNTGKGGHRGTV